MAFNFSSRDEQGMNDINITPFVDVVLVLLVIFMVATPLMVKDSLLVKLPSSKSSDVSEPAKLGIAINKTGQILLNGNLISTDTLRAEAELALSNDQNVKALISADQETMHKDIVKVIDIIKQVGIEKFAFQIERIVSE